VSNEPKKCDCSDMNNAMMAAVAYVNECRKRGLCNAFIFQVAHFLRAMSDAALVPDSNYASVMYLEGALKDFVMNDQGVQEVMLRTARGIQNDA
jgi:hypothetical protein